MLLITVSKNQLKTHTLQDYFGQYGGEIQIRQAPEPQKINWENINIPSSKIIRRAILSWIIFIVLLGVLTTTFFFLPIKPLLGFVHPQKFLSSGISYHELKEKKFSSYQLFNPITKQEALKIHFEKIESITNREINSKDMLNTVGGGHNIKAQRKHSIVRPHMGGKSNTAHKASLNYDELSQIQLSMKKPERHDKRFVKI